jgi:hypothetical protein
MTPDLYFDAVFRGRDRIHCSISFAPASSTTWVLTGGICFAPPLSHVAGPCAALFSIGVI